MPYVVLSSLSNPEKFCTTVWACARSGRLPVFEGYLFCIQDVSFDSALEAVCLAHDRVSLLNWEIVFSEATDILGFPIRCLVDSFFLGLFTAEHQLLVGA